MKSRMRQRSAKRNSTSASVVKAFAILDVVASKSQDGISLVEVAKQLRMSKSTTHRYLTTLEKLGATERNQKDGFRLGTRLIELAGITLSGNDLRKQGDAFLDELAGKTQEAVHLAVASGIEVVYIAKADSKFPIQMYSRIGGRMPMYCTALGKAILAHSSVALVNEVIRGGLLPRTPGTITSADALFAELERMRGQGYAIDNQENEVGVCCVGAAIFDYNAKVIGAISVSGLAERMTKERQLELGPMVADAALRLSRRLGYSG